MRRLRTAAAKRLIRKVHSMAVSKDLLDADYRRWTSFHMMDYIHAIEDLYLECQEFRNLFFFRVKEGNKYVRMLGFFYPPLPTLCICTPDIGPGFFLQHGFSTIIAARKIGRNCWINQQVTIGFSTRDDAPTIGDDVSIYAGAIIIGRVSIGDRSKIGAGAVVVGSVPPDCTVVGNPARIIRRNGQRVNEPLALSDAARITT